MKRHFFDYIFICHKMPSRSFFYKGKQFPICSRCTGIFIGYIIGILILVIGIFIPLFIINFYFSILLIIPMVIDGTIQYFTKYESNNLKRVITGFFSGIGIIFFLFYIGRHGFITGRAFIEQLLN